MSAVGPLWISEADVVEVMDLERSIGALEKGLVLEAGGRARAMAKTHVSWGDGHTLHSLGASFEGAGLVGVKSWAHTHGGASPMLMLWDSETGSLRALIEAFALGQMRTGAMSAVATRWMARPDATTLALIGTGKQAFTQVAAVAAVRPLRQVRIFSPTPEHRRAFVEKLVEKGLDFEVVEAGSVQEAVAGSHIVTLATRAREPFFMAALAQPGTHINAVGAITPERQEFTLDVFARAGWIATDEPAAAQRLSREFADYFAASPAAWAKVESLSAIVAAARERPAGCDLSLFKAMGLGTADVALAAEILRQVEDKNMGRRLDHPVRVQPRLGKLKVSEKDRR